MNKNQDLKHLLMTDTDAHAFLGDSTNLRYGEEGLNTGGLHLPLLIAAVRTELSLWDLLLCVLLSRCLALLQAVLTLQALQTLAV